MARGLKDINDQAASSGGGSGTGEFINLVRLRDDLESVTGRFLTGHEEIYSEWCHRYQDVSNKGKQFWVTCVCPGQLGNPCERCNNGETCTLIFFAWFHVQHIDWASQGPGRTQVQAGDLTRYRETINKVRLFQHATMHIGAINEMVAEYGTLMDREYKWTRRGVAGTTRPSYSLRPVGEPSPLSPELEEVIGQLPDLEEVAFRRVRKLNIAGEEPPTVDMGAGDGGLAPAGEGPADPGLPNEENPFGDADF